MVSEWGNVPYPQLSVLLVHARHLYNVNQTHHWTASGDSFFGDHQLFQRLYERAIEDIDSIAEKVIGLGMSENVYLPLQVSQLSKLTSEYGSQTTLPHPNELAKRSLACENRFITVCGLAAAQIIESGAMTR